MKCLEVECAVARYFNPRVNLPIPNVSWAFLHYEADLLILTKAGYLYEVEIKVSRADLKKDLLKIHGHNYHKISRLYFAIPAALLEHKNLIPSYAGILVCYEDGICLEERAAEKRNGYKLNEKEITQLYRLGALKIWNVKNKLLKLSLKD